MVFRGERGDLPHTMEREFPLLLSEENSDNMRIIEENERICSVVNFLPRRIAIEGAPISTASIGAVCTHPHYRGRGYSTRILKDVEESMKKAGINLCFISGTRDLYRKWGAGRVKNCIRYRIYPKEHILSYKVRKYREGDLSSIKKIYNSQGTRYMRSSEDFDALIDSGTFPFGETSYERYVMEEGKGLGGYIILKRTPQGVVVKEAGGEMEEIFKSLAHLAYKLETDRIDYILPLGEKVPEGWDGGEEYLQGTLKVIDARGLKDELTPYFRQYVDEYMANSFTIEGVKGGYRMCLGDEVLDISSHDELLKIIFEGNSNRINGRKMKGFLEKVFPLPLPWTENLNYQ